MTKSPRFIGFVKLAVHFAETAIATVKVRLLEESVAQDLAAEFGLAKEDATSVLRDLDQNEARARVALTIVRTRVVSLRRAVELARISDRQWRPAGERPS